jgi:hypothetical protein
MASTYVNDLRLNEMATGDGSGTWGTTTNTNLELIAEAFSYGTEAITTNADTHTTTIADGASDPGRALYLKYTGTLDSACTITIGPNTVSKVWIIENGTSGSQNIIISQGSGANITIPAGDTKVVYSDGAGAGAAFFDAFASLSVVDLKVQDDLTVTDDASIGGDATITGTLGVTGNITGTLATAAQPNITSVGTLTGFTSTGIDDNATSTAITIDSSENVGIGTSSPGTYQLAVDSGTSGTSNALAGIFVEGQRNGVVYNLVSNNTDNGTDKGSGIQFRSGGFLTSGIIGRSDTVAASGDAPGYLSFHTSTDGSEDFAERMRIDSSGNLLVGTTDTFPGGGDTNTGVSLTNSGAVVASRDGDFAARFNRKTSDGDIVQFNIDGTTVGSIGSTSGFFFIGGTEGTDAYISFGSAGVRPATSAGAARDAAVDLGGSTNRFKDLYLSGGVYVGGTGAANLLDDYEEGTWTPDYDTSDSDLANFSIFSAATAGKYTKVGNQVTVYGSIATFNAASISGTGIIRITGLPFSASANTNGGYKCVALTEDSRFTNNPQFGLVSNGTTYLSLYKTTAMNTANSMSVSDMSATNTANFNLMSFVITYMTS